MNIELHRNCKIAERKLIRADDNLLKKEELVFKATAACKKASLKSRIALKQWEIAYDNLHKGLWRKQNTAMKKLMASQQTGLTP